MIEALGIILLIFISIALLIDLVCRLVYCIAIYSHKFKSWRLKHQASTNKEINDIMKTDQKDGD
jgi:hypothetical protein